MHRRHSGLILAAAAFWSGQVEGGFWRMNCGKVAVGRVDPIVNPGAISSHVHNVVGGYNFDLNSTFNDMVNSKCTSCEIAADKSAYWTPQLYYQHTNGSSEEVPNGGLIVYYLGRGDNLVNVKPFPPGFAMLSGNNFVRSYDSITKTWNGARNVADRVSFVCLNSNNQYPETPNMQYTSSCSSGMRAQIHFQSCWDGVNLYKTDNSHVAYMSSIDGGSCPSTHPVQLIHLFYEAYYSVNAIDQSDGGRFVFSNGDTTGYGFHGDFLNGWDNNVLTNALAQCAQGPPGSGTIGDCAPLAAVDTTSAARNCPERGPMLDEPVKGMLSKLPGCNAITSGPASATTANVTCGPNVSQPAIIPFTKSTLADAPNFPAINSTTNGWRYLGSANDISDSRALGVATWGDDGMTIEKCQQFCSSKSLQLAGLEYSRECWCGTVLNSNTAIDTTYSTIYNSMVCAGNGTEFCGGPSRILVFNNTQYAPPFPSTIGATLGTSTYLGCASEVAGRSLSAKRTSLANMTVQTCASFCSGYALFGVEYSAECYCDNQLAAGSTYGQTNCNMACSGDNTQICGGPNALTVFNNTAYHISEPPASTTTSIPAPTPSAPSDPIANVSTAGSFTYVGCANENNSNPGRALPGASYSNATVTNEQCTAFCAAQNYKYAGTEYGRECYCGNDLEFGSTATQTGCNMKCTGTLSANSLFAAYASNCGGSNLVSVWRNENYQSVRAPPSVGTYASQGCYTEGNGQRALTGASYSNANMTIEVCVAYCKAKGFVYAGAEYAAECYCGNSLTSGAILASDATTCNMLCKGNQYEYCGGANRLNLYKSSPTSRVKRRMVLVA